MDLGLKGKWALVGGASKGLGFGCANSLAREGVNVVMVARGNDRMPAEVRKGHIRMLLLEMRGDGLQRWRVPERAQEAGSALPCHHGL